MAGIVIAGFGFRASAVLDSLTSALEKQQMGWLLLALQHLLTR